MNSPNRRRFVRHLLIIVGAVGLVTLASGCVVPTPGPASKLPATYVAPVGLTIGPIQYGPDSVQLLDLYLPDPSQRPSPVIIYMHSGGFIGGNRSAVSQAIQREVLRGYAVASIDYHLSPAVQFPVALQDVKTAIRWAKVDGPNYALQPDEVFVAGSSAGGNLAAMAAVTAGQFEPTNLPASYAAVDSRPRGAITMSGVLDLVDTGSVGWGTGFVPAYVGSTDPNAMAQASPINYVDATSPPMYIAQGRWDALCRPDQSGRTMALRYALVGRAAVAYYDLVKNQGHNLDVDGMNITVFDFWLDAVRDGRIS
jgi:acetyl esterase/lipase